MMYVDVQQEAPAASCAWCAGEIYLNDTVWFDGFSTYVHDECLKEIEDSPEEAPIAVFIKEDYRKSTMRDLIESAREDERDEV